MYKKILAGCLSLSLVLLGVALGRHLPVPSTAGASGPSVAHAHSGPTIEQVRGLSSLTVLKVDVADVQVTELRVAGLRLPGGAERGPVGRGVGHPGHRAVDRPEPQEIGRASCRERVLDHV